MPKRVKEILTWVGTDIFITGRMAFSSNTGFRELSSEVGVGWEQFRTAELNGAANDKKLNIIF